MTPSKQNLQQINGWTDGWMNKKQCNSHAFILELRCKCSFSHKIFVVAGFVQLL